jgi:hypothetical protein
MYARNRTHAGLAIFTIVILAGSLGYYYSSASAQISSLKSDGRLVCTNVSNAYMTVLDIFSNTTAAMRQQINDDNSVIAALNSTRPSGYANMTATLQGEIAQDTSILNAISSATAPVDSVSKGVGGGLCAPFY